MFRINPWELMHIAWTVAQMVMLAINEPVNAETPIPVNPQLTVGGETFELSGAGGAPLVIKRLK